MSDIAVFGEKCMAFFWIIPKALAGASIPWGEDDLRFWWRSGIRVVVVLVEDYELDVPIETYKEIGFDVLWEPTRDMTAPSIDTLLRICRWIKKRIDNNKPVVVHCYGGLGRTGTVLAAYLVFQGWDPIQAIDYVRSIRPGAIQTTTQYARVVEFANFLKEISR